MKYCNFCEKHYSDNEYYCLSCNRPLTKINEQERQKNIQEQKGQEQLRKRNEQLFSQTKYQPKCPLCQSPNIQQISLVKRGVGGAMFGLFSKTARSQWECKNCGNKF